MSQPSQSQSLVPFDTKLFLRVEQSSIDIGHALFNPIIFESFSHWKKKLCDGDLFKVF